jgi:hypothetical protein
MYVTIGRRMRCKISDDVKNGIGAFAQFSGVQIAQSGDVAHQ